MYGDAFTLKYYIFVHVYINMSAKQGHAYQLRVNAREWQRSFLARVVQVMFPYSWAHLRNMTFMIRVIRLFHHTLYGKILDFIFYVY